MPGCPVPAREAIAKTMTIIVCDTYLGTCCDWSLEKIRQEDCWNLGGRMRKVPRGGVDICAASKLTVAIANGLGGVTLSHDWWFLHGNDGLHFAVFQLSNFYIPTLHICSMDKVALSESAHQIDSMAMSALMQRQWTRYRFYGQLSIMIRHRFHGNCQEIYLNLVYPTARYLQFSPVPFVHIRPSRPRSHTFMCRAA